ncbi:MAG: ATP-binding cassette domain-containing protein, partial [Pirellula sp.]|nr:ATP-binding cassette domain-containing protein [Pirellula sp.]
MRDLLPKSRQADCVSVSTSGLTKRYGLHVACDGIDLCISKGTTFGLLGPNGAGKSTLIRMLMGLTEKDSGRATVLGCEDLRSSILRQRVGYVPELHYMYRWMSVQEILEFAGPLYTQWDAELAEDLIDRFELPKKKKVSSLSKGMTA